MLLQDLSARSSIRQASKPEQVAGLFECGMLGQFVNVDAAIGKNAAVSIDVTNAGVGGNDAFQTFRGLSAGHAGHSLSLSFKMITCCGSRARGRGECNLTFIPQITSLTSKLADSGARARRAIIFAIFVKGNRHGTTRSSFRNRLPRTEPRPQTSSPACSAGTCSHAGPGNHDQYRRGQRHSRPHYRARPRTNHYTIFYVQVDDVQGYLTRLEPGWQDAGAAG
jgi:hypothetical protein